MPRKIHDPINDFIRGKIRNVRVQKCLSTRQVSALAGIPEGSYCCLENGFYRISLSNLQKIMRALELSIHEVWPEPLAPQPTIDADAGSPSLAAVHYFRFREVCELTQAQSAALIYRNSDDVRVLFSHNLSDAEKADLTRRISNSNGNGVGEGWAIHRKTDRKASMAMCLTGTAAEEPLLNLIEVYLDLWLATQVASAS